MPTTTLFKKLTQIVKSVTTPTEHLSKPQPYHGNTPPNPSSLRLGYTNNLTGPAFDIPNTTFCGVPYRGKPPARHNLTRHLLLIGPPGSGTSNLQLYLLTQQIQRGSGFIFIDTSSDPNTLLNLTHQLKLASRLTDLLCINLNTETPNHNIAHSISSNQCVYISMPTPLNKTTLNFATTLLQNLQTQLGQLGTLPPKQPHPFILLANDLHTYAPPTIASLFAQARAFNISIIASLQSLDNLTNPPLTYATILQNTCTKVVFKPSSPSPELLQLLSTHYNLLQNLDVGTSLVSTHTNPPCIITTPTCPQYSSTTNESFFSEN